MPRPPVHTLPFTNLIRRLSILGVVIAAIVVAVVLIAANDDDEVPKGAVAGVDGKPVTKEQFDRWLGVISAVQQPPNSKSKKKPEPPKPGSKNYEQTAQQVMQFLVSSLWVAGEAADRGLTATPKEIQRQFSETKKQSFPTEKAYQRFLEQTGQSQEDIMFRVRLDVLSNKIRQDVTRGTTDIGDEEVKQYYDQNEAQFSQPERRDIQMVLTNNEAKAREAQQRIQGGESFKRVAKALSKDPATKDQGGQLLGVTKGQQETDFDAALFAAPKGKLTGPIKTDQGYYVFQVTKITAATKQGLEQSKEGIRQLLISQKQQTELDSFTTDFREKWREATICLEDLAIPDCSNGEQPPPAGLGTGPAAKAGTGNPPALGGVPQPQVPGSAPGAVPPTGVPGAPPTITPGPTASAPPALTGGGGAPAVTGTPALGAGGGVPGGVVPGGAQGGAPPVQGGAPPPGG